MHKPHHLVVVGLLLAAGCVRWSDPAYSPVELGGGPTPRHDQRSLGQELRGIAASFRELPRPLVERYEFRPAKKIVSGTPSPGVYGVHWLGGASEPILNRHAMAFLRRHSPIELDAALWPYENDPRYPGDVRTLLGSTESWREAWPGDLPRAELDELQRQGQIRRGSIPPFSSLNGIIRSSDAAPPFETRTVEADIVRAIRSRVPSADAIWALGVPATWALKADMATGVWGSDAIAAVFGPAMAHDPWAFTIAASAASVVALHEQDVYQRNGESTDQWCNRVPEARRIEVTERVRLWLRSKFESVRNASPGASSAKGTTHRPKQQVTPPAAPAPVRLGCGRSCRS